MTLVRTLPALAALSLSVLVACSSPAPAPSPAATEAPAAAPTAAAPTLAPTAVPSTEAPTPSPVPPAAEAAPAPLSFTPATYVDAQAGFALDYPADWTLDPSSQVGVRGGQALLLSPGTTPETLAEGGTRISIVTYLWDPKRDIDAYAAQRKLAWDASGFVVTREESFQLADGRAAYAFAVQTHESSFFAVVTTVGEDYLQVTGEGNLSLAEEIIRTLRPQS